MGRGEQSEQASGQTLLFGPRQTRSVDRPRTVADEHWLLQRAGLQLGSRQDAGSARYFEDASSAINGHLTHHHDGRLVIAAELDDEGLAEALAEPGHPVRALLERVEAAGGGDMLFEVCFPRALPKEGRRETPLAPLSERLQALAPQADWEISDWEMEGGWKDPYRSPQAILSTLLKRDLEQTPTSLRAMLDDPRERAEMDSLGLELYFGLAAPVSDLLAFARAS